jgi:hypothetical protein
MCSGIFFKLAIDDSGVYGGGREGDAHAAKAAGHDLKGAIHVLECQGNIHQAGQARLRVPLQALVDYMGFRVMAMAELPITEDCKSKPLYGSNDGGRTVRAADAKLNALMAATAAQLNLVEHKVNGVSMHLAADVEGVQGTDGQYYALDFARVFPPEHREGTPHLPTVKRSIFWRLLRPELVKQHPDALSSDALSCFGKGHGSAAHSQHVHDATKNLVGEIIPTFAEELLVLVEEEQLGLCSSDVAKHDVISRIHIEEEMHKRGINLRHLGAVHGSLAALEPTPDSKATQIAKQLLISEMLSRTIKVLFQHRMRSMLEAHATASHINQTTADFFNLVTGFSGIAQQFWNVQVSSSVANHFGPEALSNEENLHAYVMENLPLHKAVVSRALFMCAVLPTEGLFVRALADSKQGSSGMLSSMEVHVADIETISPKSKSMTKVDFAVGMMLASMVSKHPAGSAQSLRLLSRAVSTLKKALALSPDPNVSRQYSWVLAQQAVASGQERSILEAVTLMKKMEKCDLNGLADLAAAMQAVEGDFLNSGAHYSCDGNSQKFTVAIYHFLIEKHSDFFLTLDLQKLRLEGNMVNPLPVQQLVLFTGKLPNLLELKLLDSDIPLDTAVALACSCPKLRALETTA